MRSVRLPAVLALLALPALAQEEPRVPRLLNKPIETDHFSITAHQGIFEDFREMVEGLHGVWTAKLGPAAPPAEKLKIVYHYSYEEYGKVGVRGTSQTVAGDALHLLADPYYFQSAATGGAKLYLAKAYPKTYYRKDIPPALLSALADYVGCAAWVDKTVVLDTLKNPQVMQSILSLQQLIKLGEWWPVEKGLKAEGREYEIRQRIIDLEIWGLLYWLSNAPGPDGGKGAQAKAVADILGALEEGAAAVDTVQVILKKAGVSSLSAVDKVLRDYFQKMKVEVADREDGDWLVGETAHYTIRVQKGATNKKTKMPDRMILQDLKFKMELMFEKYALAFRFQGRMQRRAMLRLYKNRGAYVASGAPPTSAAYYNPGTKELVGYEDSEETNMVFNVLCHEGCHQFFDLAFPGFYQAEVVPMWFSEGLADCFGASELRGKDIYIFTLGGVAHWRIETVKEMVQSGRFTPLKDLVGLDRMPFMANGGPNYAQSWSFVHFLWNAPTLDAGKGRYSEVVIRLIDGFKAGKPRDEVYKDAFQLKGQPLNFDQLETEWKAYVKTLRKR